MEHVEQSKFTGWAIVELMGHQREIGYVTTEAFGQAVLFRVDTPELPEREFDLEHPEWIGGQTCGIGSKVKRESSPARSRLVSPQALYAINPCSEKAAMKALDQMTSRPLMLIELKEPETRALPEAELGVDCCTDCGKEFADCGCPL